MLAHIDRAFVSAAIVLYFVVAYSVLPSSAYWSGLGVAAAVFAAALVVAPRLPGTLRGDEFLYVTLGSFFLFIMPTAPAMGGEGGVSSLIAIFGIQVAVMLWTALRWDYSAYRLASPIPLGTALKAGAVGAAGLSGIAAVPILVGVLFAAREAWPLLGVFPAYFIGMLSAAVIVWLFQHVAHLAVGRYWLGVFCGTCLYLAVMPIVVFIRDFDFPLATNLAGGLLCGTLVGPCVAVAWRAEAP